MKTITSPRYLLTYLLGLSLLLLTSCSSDALEKENKTTVANRVLLAPSKLLKIVNDTPLTMTYTLVISADPNHDYSFLDNEFYLTQEIKINPNQTVVLSDFSSTYNQGLSVEGDKWYLTQNGVFIQPYTSSNANIDFGTFINGVDATDGYYCQWKILKGGLFGTYLSTDIYGFSSNLLSPFFGGYTAVINPIKYYNSSTGQDTPYFSFTSVVGDPAQVNVTVNPIQQ